MKGQARLLALGVAIAIASCTGDNNDPASRIRIVILGAPIDGQVAVGGGFVLYPEVHDAMGNGVRCNEPFRWANSNPVALEMAPQTDIGSVLVMARGEGTALLTVRCDNLKASVSVRVVAAAGARSTPDAHASSSTDARPAAVSRNTARTPSAAARPARLVRAIVTALSFTT